MKRKEFSRSRSDRNYFVVAATRDRATFKRRWASHPVCAVLKSNIGWARVFFSAICRVSWRVDRTRGLYGTDVTGTSKCSWLGNVEYRLDSARQVERSERNLTLNETLVTKARLPANSLSTGYPWNSTLRSRPRVNAGWIFCRGVALGYSRITLWP